MAAITISATGGNWNSTATWVGGVIPTTTDHVVGISTSGQLTINVSASIQRMDLTGYNNTITFNSGQTLTLNQSGGTTIFDVNNVFAGTGTLALANVAQTIEPGGCTSRIPNLSNAGGTKTLVNDDFYISNYSATSGSTTWGGGQRILVNGNFTAAVATHDAGGTGFRFDGTGTISGRFLRGSYDINTAGTLTFSSDGLTFLDNGTVTYTTGTVTTPFLRLIASATGTFTINTSGMTWDSVSINGAFTSTGTATISLSSNLNAVDFIFSSDRGYIASNYTFSGTGALTVTGNAILQGNGTYTQDIIRLNTTAAHSFQRLFTLSSSLTAGRLLIRSTTNGVQATLSLGDKNNSPIMYTDFTDINAGGGQEIRTYSGTVSNCSNVVSYTSTIFGGAAGGSFTFVM